MVHNISRNVLEFNVTWNKSIENGGSVILDFMITLLHANGSMVRRQNAIKETSLHLKHLRQNRTYIVILQARNIVGYGESKNITVTTLEAGENQLVIFRLCSMCSVSQSVRQTDREENRDVGDISHFFSKSECVSTFPIFLSENQMVNQPLYRIVSRSVSQSVHRLSGETIGQSSI